MKIQLGIFIWKKISIPPYGNHHSNNCFSQELLMDAKTSVKYMESKVLLMNLSAGQHWRCRQGEETYGDEGGRKWDEWRQLHGNICNYQT